MPSLQSISENLTRAEREFLRAAESIPSNQWQTRPAEDRWSAGELVCHLIQVEKAICKNTGKLLQHPPKPRPLSKRFHLPMALVEARLIPRKTPIPLNPALMCEKERMLAQLCEVRQETRVFMEETAGKDLRKYHMPHPFVGTLNFYEWFQMIASHQIRHTKQIREIAAALRKSIEGVQK